MKKVNLKGLRAKGSKVAKVIKKVPGEAYAGLTSPFAKELGRQVLIVSLASLTGRMITSFTGQNLSLKSVSKLSKKI